MARAAKATKTTKSAATGRQAGRSPMAAAKIPVKIGRAAAACERAPVAVPAAPKRNKDDLRAEVEKLESTVAALRAKNRETKRAAKTAAARIAELEDQVAQLEQSVASQPAAARLTPKQTKPSGGKRTSGDIDPGDAVPPGVAVQEPAPLDEEAETARTNLEEHLAEE